VRPHDPPGDAEPPSDPPTPPPAEAFAALAARLSGQLGPVFARVAAALRPLLDFANSPQGQQMIAEHRRRQRLGLNDTEACHCLCGLRHPDRQVCQGEVLRRALLPVQIGAVAVPMCAPCAAAPTTSHAAAAQ
jgi:hypothetical protein